MSDRRAQVETFLTDVLAKMGFAARLEVKDVEEPPAISVAVFPEGELPGLTSGKRTPVVEALQFLSNKVVNRGPDKKWVNVGVGAHPEPRVPGQKKPREEKEKAQQPQPARGAAAANGAAAGASADGGGGRAEGAGKPRREKQQKGERSGGQQQGQGGGRQGREPDESTLEVSEDAALSAAGRALAEKSAQLGRVYAVTAMGAEDRARLLRAAEGIGGLKVRAEGEGRHRRVAYLPAEPKPMPKKSHLPDYDEDDEQEE